MIEIDFLLELIAVDVRTNRLDETEDDKLMEQKIIRYYRGADETTRWNAPFIDAVPLSKFHGLAPPQFGTMVWPHDWGLTSNQTSIEQL